MQPARSSPSVLWIRNPQAHKSRAEAVARSPPSGRRPSRQAARTAGRRGHARQPLCRALGGRCARAVRTRPVLDRVPISCTANTHPRQMFTFCSLAWVFVNRKVDPACSSRLSTDARCPPEPDRRCWSWVGHSFSNNFYGGAGHCRAQIVVSYRSCITGRPPPFRLCPCRRWIGSACRSRLCATTPRVKAWARSLTCLSAR